MGAEQSAAERVDTGAEEVTGGATETDGGSDDAHLDDVDDGCGCTEVWEHLSEQRDD